MASAVSSATASSSSTGDFVDGPPLSLVAAAAAGRHVLNDNTAGPPLSCGGILFGMCCRMDHFPAAVGVGGGEDLDMEDYGDHEGNGYQYGGRRISDIESEENFSSSEDQALEVREKMNSSLERSMIDDRCARSISSYDTDNNNNNDTADHNLDGDTSSIPPDNDNTSLDSADSTSSLGGSHRSTSTSGHHKRAELASVSNTCRSTSSISSSISPVVIPPLDVAKATASRDWDDLHEEDEVSSIYETRSGAAIEQSLDEPQQGEVLVEGLKSAEAVEVVSRHVCHRPDTAGRCPLTLVPEEVCDPYEDDRRALELLQRKFHEAIRLYHEEQLLRPKMLIDTILRETDKRLARTSILASDEQTAEYVEEVRKLKFMVTESAEVKLMNTKMDIMVATFEFFSLEHVVESANFLSAASRSFTGGNRTPGLAESQQHSFEKLAAESSYGFDGGTTDVGSPSKTGKSGKKTARKRMSRIGRSFSGRRHKTRGGGTEEEKSKHFFRKRRKGGSRVESHTGGGGGGGDPGAVPWIEDKQKGLKLSYRTEANGSISVKVRGKLRTELYEVLAVVSETSYYHLWIPYLKEARDLNQVSRCSRLVQMISEYPWPIKFKESIMYAFGVDALDECGSIIICGTSPAEGATEYLGLPVPPPPKKVQRVPCNHLCFILTPLDQGKATMLEVYSNLDPGVNIRLLSSILQWVVKKSVKGFYVKVSHLCDNFVGSDFEKRAKENPELFEWIKNRIRDYYASVDTNCAVVRALEDSMVTLRIEDFKEFL